MLQLAGGRARDQCFDALAAWWVDKYNSDLDGLPLLLLGRGLHHPRGSC